MNYLLICSLLIDFRISFSKLDPNLVFIPQLQKLPYFAFEMLSPQFVIENK